MQDALSAMFRGVQIVVYFYRLQNHLSCATLRRGAIPKDTTNVQACMLSTSHSQQNE